MISAIFTLIFKIINFILSFIISLVFKAFPNFGLDSLRVGITAFFNMIGNAFNLVYFIFGPTAFILGDIIILLFTLKHIVLPIVNFMRKIVTR